MLSVLFVMAAPARRGQADDQTQTKEREKKVRVGNEDKFGYRERCWY
jgi:hypothetical protein